MEQISIRLQLTIKTDKESEFLEQFKTLCKRYAEGDYSLDFRKTNELEEDLEEKFIWLVRSFLGSEILFFDIYGDFQITLNLRDINLKIGRVQWEDALEEHLSKENIKIRFDYGNENWVTIKLIN